MNNSFSNIVKVLGISDYMDSHPLAKEINDPIRQAVKQLSL